MKRIDKREQLPIEGRRRCNARTYGLTPFEFDRLLEVQDNKCAICEKPFTETNVPNIDHDHKCCDTEKWRSKKSCGKCVRGLLCRMCNMLLGFTNDDQIILKRAQIYLDFHSKV